MPTDRDRSALARNLDQGAVTAGGLHAHPVALELGALGATTIFELDHQLAPLQNDLFAVTGVTRINQKRSADSHELQPGKWQHKTSALRPEQGTNTERNDTNRQVKLAQLGGGDGAISLEQPLHSRQVLLALRAQGAKAKLGWRIHGTLTIKRRRDRQRERGNMPKGR